MKIKGLLSAALTIILTLSMVTGFDSCKIDPMNGAKLIINYDLIKTFINVQFVDAATGDLIGQSDNTEVKVVITGANADAVLDNTGVKKDEYYSTNGFMGLALNPNNEYVPTVSNPIKFTIVASLEGYISTSKGVTIGKEGTYNEKIVMTNISNPPNGVVVKEEKGIGNLVGGALQDEVTVKTQNDEASITIPAGTIIKDGDGNTLSGTLDITLVYFNNIEDESLAAFPGGLMTTIIQDGQAQDGVFFSAGFLAIEITDQNGLTAEKFEVNTAELNMMVDDRTYNPETQAQVEDGNVVPLFSYNTENGEWNFDQEVTIEGGVRSTFDVTAQISHLSYWNFDWFWGFPCPDGIQFLFVGDYSACGCTEFTGIMRKQADNTFFSYIYFWACEGVPIQTLWAPPDMPVSIEWDQGCSSLIVDEDITYIQNLCAPDIMEIYFSVEGGNTTVVSVDIMGRCAANANVEVRPTYGAWYRPAGSWCWKWAFMYAGHVEICDVVIGQEYVIGTYFNGQWYEHTELVTQDTYIFWEIDLPDDFCTEIL